MKKFIPFITIILLFFGCQSDKTTQPGQSVARQWNEALLAAIRIDFARPTVHARNLFHTAIALYDAWALYDDTAQTYLLGQPAGGTNCAFNGFPIPAEPHRKKLREETMSFAAYRLLSLRFQNSPGSAESQTRFNTLLARLGFSAADTSTDYSGGSAAAMGNYLAQCIISYGFQDGSNEQSSYASRSYLPVNPPIVPELPGNPDIIDLNRWQAISLTLNIDQAGNIIPGGSSPFLSPEWGLVTPFSLTPGDLSIYQRDGFDYWVYHDPGPPPTIDVTSGSGLSSEYQWGFSLVSIWSSHLDPSDQVLWDISPGTLGNLQSFPQSFPDFRTFYDTLNGGDLATGHALNPRTGEAYAPNIVPRGDYTRVLAEYWADGPDSETPPGHWFVILNEVNDHPLLEKKFKGEGPLLDPLEWDVKAYFALGGAMHDAAVSAWGIKGWYDYIRPVSAIRGMAERGQSSEPASPNYDIGGMPLEAGFVELVTADDPLAGDSGEHVGKIKLFAWLGPNFVADAETDTAGVGWILAENWWPYQRPSFVTPPFAGYVSGHSTYSRAAAEILTQLTGDPFFPGGIGEYTAKKDDFLVFENGPSTDVTLQWATYRDASDQTSLSRIWGGIHPPADDIPGRIIGESIGLSAFALAEQYFLGQ